MQLLVPPSRCRRTPADGEQRLRGVIGYHPGNGSLRRGGAPGAVSSWGQVLRGGRPLETEPLPEVTQVQVLHSKRRSEPIMTRFPASELSWSGLWNQNENMLVLISVSWFRSWSDSFRVGWTRTRTRTRLFNTLFWVLLVCLSSTRDSKWTFSF